MQRLTKASSTNTCIYIVLEGGKYKDKEFSTGDLEIIPFRLCHKHKKEVR